MDPFTISLAAGAISGGIKYFTGRKQKRRAKRIRRRAQSKFDKNPFRTPTEALRALEVSQNLASQTRMPGQDLMEQQIAGATGSAIEASRSAAVTPQEVAAGATSAYQNLYINPLRNLGVSAAQNFAQNQANYQNQLGNVAQFRNMEWQQNVLAPYERAMQTAGQLESAGQQNMFSGVSDVLGSATNFAAGRALQQRNANMNASNAFIQNQMAFTQPTGGYANMIGGNNGFSNSLNMFRTQ